MTGALEEFLRKQETPKHPIFGFPLNKPPFWFTSIPYSFKNYVNIRQLRQQNNDNVIRMLDLPADFFKKWENK